MTTLRAALRLADALQAGADDPMWADHCEMSKRTASLAAAELRRLCAVNEELLELLIEAREELKVEPEMWEFILRIDAAIAKAGEQA